MFSPLETSPDHIKLLGIITARWAYLDFHLSFLTCHIVKNWPIAEAIYFSSSAQKLRFDTLSALIKATEWSEEEKKTALKLINKLRKLWDKRNNLIHNPAYFKDGIFESLTGTHTGEFYVSITKPIRENPRQKKDLTIKELQEHANKLQKIGDEIWQFIQRNVDHSELDVALARALANTSNDTPE